MKVNKKELQNKKASLLGKEIENALGFKIDIDTLTSIKTKVTGQKFYEVQPSEYMPVVVGEHAFNENILTYKDFSLSNDFESGILNGSTNRSQLESADAAIEGIQVPIKDWAKKIAYNIMELQKASQSGNWSLIESKERARFKNWQLGIQQVAFLGTISNPNVLGLLTQSDVTINSTTITKFIKDMTPAEFQAFLAQILDDYYANANNTVLPDTFVIPTADYLGLGTAVDETFNMKSRLQRIKESFAEITMNPNFKVMPLAYAQKERNSAILNPGTGFNRYTLYRSSDEESLRMDVPVDYTTTIADTFDGFHYNSVAYGQFSGCKSYRPQEMIYFDHAL